MTLIGDKTKFTTDFKKGDTLKIILDKKDKTKIEDQIIDEIKSDTELILKSPGANGSDPEKAYKYKIIPKVDQSIMFKSVETVLSEGGCIGIYPEGGSHD